MKTGNFNGVLAIGKVRALLDNVFDRCCFELTFVKHVNITYQDCSVL